MLISPRMASWRKFGSIRDLIAKVNSETLKIFIRDILTQIFKLAKRSLFVLLWLMSKKVLVIGNWKMYKTAHEAALYIKTLASLVKGEVLLAVPFTAIHAAAEAASGTNIVIGAQNLHEAPEGAFTGEVSGPMLKEAGASFVLIGHSERRTLFKETDEMIHSKVLRALQDDLMPVLCVGETLEEREEGLTEKVLKRQLTVALEGVADEMIVAYEPVWAIGTGKIASVQMIAEAHAICRKYAGPLTRVLYGGSVKPENVAALVAHKEVDGVLVGGASLSPQTFAQIVMKVGL